MCVCVCVCDVLSNTGLQAPADSRCPGDVVGGRVEEVERAIETGALEQRLLEQVRWRVHVHVVGQLARLPLAQTYYYYYYYYYFFFKPTSTKPQAEKLG